MDDIKIKTAKFMQGNIILILLPIALFLIAVANSWLALGLYFIIIHLMCIVYIVGLYEPGWIAIKIERINRERLSFAGLLFCSAIIVLGMRGYWYLLVVTIVATILAAVHIIDALQRSKRKEV